MTGKELFQQPIKFTFLKEEIVDKDLNLYWTGSNGEEVKIALSYRYRNRDEIAKMLKLLWSSIDHYQIVGNILCIPAQTYWFFYKRVARGANFFKSSSYRLYLNGISLRFPEAAFYFSTAIPQTRGGAGVYGIYLDDKLIYIGSATNLTERWCQHDECFRKKDTPKNVMYALGDRADEIEYRELENYEDISRLTGVTDPSMWIYELVEAIYIKIFQPKYNKAGVTESFSFKANPGDLPLSYWDIVQSKLVKLPFDDELVISIEESSQD